MVKEGIRKLKFSQQIKKAEGTKTPKAELTVSIDGVAIQEPKTKKIQHQYPLHRFCSFIEVFNHLVMYIHLTGYHTVLMTRQRRGSSVS